MDLHDLDGRPVLGVLCQPEAVAIEYIRGLAYWSGLELRVASEVGQVYDVPASFAAAAQAVTDGVREAAPAEMRALLAGAEFVVPIPTSGGGDIALAVTPGWSRPPAA